MFQPYLSQPIDNHLVVATTSLRTNNKLLSKLKSEVFYENHKRTQQEVLNELVPYLYDTCMVHAIDK